MKINKRMLPCLPSANFGAVLCGPGARQDGRVPAIPLCSAFPSPTIQRNIEAKAMAGQEQQAVVGTFESFA